MLFEFLEANRAVILLLTEEKTIKLARNLPSSAQLKEGLPLFFDQLILILKTKNPQVANGKVLESAAMHGKELFHLGYSLSQVVHAYGAMCQAITECAEQKREVIRAKEFNHLNQSLDVAIAAAVSEFEFHSAHKAHEREVRHLGFLVHELRNALSSATVAQQMIRKGLVGTGGSTAKVLEENLTRMRILIDRSFLEIRLRTEPEILVERFYLYSMVDQIVTTANFDVQGKNVTITTDINSEIEIESDRQMLLSAVANFIQNAIKYTKVGGTIKISAAKEENDHIRIEIKDECGGLPTDKIESLFKPFTKESIDQTGLGLGLTISKRAISLIQGTITARNDAGIGCVFTIHIPRVFIPKPIQTTVVTGINSIQPEFTSNEQN